MANVGAWTNNWRGLKNAFLLGRYYEGLTTFKYNDNFAPSDGAQVYTIAGAFANVQTSFTQSMATIHVGSGINTPAATDIALTEIAGMAYLSAANEAITYDTVTGTATRTIKVTIQNQSNAQVMVCEYGLFGNCNLTPSARGILLYREVLDTPVVLDAYQSATLSVTLNITLADPV